MKVDKITQNNFFKFYNSRSNTEIKRQILNFGQKIKGIISNECLKNQQNILNKLNDITTRIQKRVNRANLTQQDLNRYEDELKPLLDTAFDSQTINIKTFFYICILLSKHDTNKETKINYFGLTNKTSNIKKLSETNDTYPRIKSLTNEDIFHLLGDVIASTPPVRSINPAPAMSKDQAAIVIQRQFRDYKTKTSHLSKAPFLIDSKTKQRIHLHMQTISKIFHSVPSADYANNKITKKELIKKSSEFRKTYNFIAQRTGNCVEIALTLYLLIKSDLMIPPHIKNNICLGELSGEDHVFVVIGSIDTPAAYIADAWLKFVNLPSSVGYRSTPSQAEDRSVGFLGRKQEYLKFLRYHEDDKFVKKYLLHQIVKKNISYKVEKTYAERLKELLLNLSYQSKKNNG